MSTKTTTTAGTSTTGSTASTLPSGAAEASREAMIAFTEAAFGIATKGDRYGRAQIDHGIAAATETADLIAGAADEMVRAREAVRESTLRFIKGMGK